MTSKSGPLPGWVLALKPIAEDPLGWFEHRAAIFVVGSVLGIIEAFTARISWVWLDVVVPAVEASGDALGFAFVGPAEALLGAVGVPASTLAAISDTLGPLSGLVLGLGLIGIAYVTYRATKASPGVLWKLYQLIPGT